MTCPSSAGTASATRQGASATWVITVEGEHDIATGPVLEQSMTRVGASCRVVVVDLSAASFIDGSVVNWLARVQGASPQSAGPALRVVLGTPPGSARRIFDLLGLEERFACYPSRDDALSVPRTIRMRVGAYRSSGRRSAR